MHERLWEEYSTQTADAAQPKSPRRIQADGGGGGTYAAMLVRRAQQTFDAATSVAQSIWLQRLQQLQRHGPGLSSRPVPLRLPA